MTKVLVTGSSGQLGSFVCELLAKDGEVAGLDKRPQPYSQLKSISLVGDITKPADVREALAGVGAVIHCAAQVSVEKSLQDPLSDSTTNVLGTVNLLHESVQAGVRRFVYVSSAAVYGTPKRIPIDEDHPTHPMSNYGASKLSGEKYALAYANTSSMEVVAVRPFNFYSIRADPDSPYSGVITRFVNRLKAGKPPIIEGDGKQTRDFIHARDVAEMLVSVLSKKGISGEVFNCGSGVSTSILDLANRAIAVSGHALMPEFSAPRVGDIRDSLSDSAKAARLLGFKLKMTLDDGLAEMIR
ncbi:MAG: NAD-dependent epimerase/dehydratase family protein [Candidatus Thermoplasmatota archaeon]|nr:NAD-dependent epimerase/dehydratase family protein [Candidatus Thermoplasmatota archaeon]